MAIIGIPQNINAASGQNYTPTAGNNRLVVFLVQTKGNPAPTAITASLGGVAATSVAETQAAFNASAILVIKEANIPAGSSAVVFGTTGVNTGFEAYVYTLEGIDQLTTVTAGGVIESGEIPDSAQWSGVITTDNSDVLVTTGGNRTANVLSVSGLTLDVYKTTFKTSAISGQSVAGPSRSFDINWSANQTGCYVAVAFNLSGADYTQRKGSTFDATHTLGTITTATLNAAAITINSTGAGTVNLTDTSGITTSGVYNLVLGDGAATETYTVQVDVIGLPAYTLNKDGAARGALTGIKAVVTATAELNGTELYSANNLTATAGVMDSGIYPNTGAVADVVTVSIMTSTGEGITFSDALEQF
jgi:hypothetical protein